MFKEVRVTALDVVIGYTCTALMLYAAYHVGKIIGKAEIADGAIKYAKNQKQQNEPKEES